MYNTSFQNTKIYGKNVLKYVPILGWTWYFTESIFLKRDWNEDKKILEKSISEIVTYPDPLWVTVSTNGMHKHLVAKFAYCL